MLIKVILFYYHCNIVLLL
uniref:Uncharacterized protein n=1 Tax=Anguilla anguilla TaxID=7936 RepID=A0A0E9QAZ5_ANGAN